MSLLHDLTCRRCFNRSFLAGVAAPLAALLGARNAQAQDKPQVPPPGGPLSTRSHVLDTGADMLQAKRPIDAMSAFLNGFHFYADDMGRQIEANHFCTHLSQDFHQCVIYDSNQADAKLIGIEYIVSERLFRTLPEEEKRLWHSHHYEVKSGQLVAPRVPFVAEHALMEDLVTTYGKTWHTWQIDRDQSLPLGIPQLMMGFVQDGQADERLLKERDQRFAVSYEEEAKNRQDILMPEVDPGANAWRSGRTVQLRLEEVELKNRR